MLFPSNFQRERQTDVMLVSDDFTGVGENQYMSQNGIYI